MPERKETVAEEERKAVTTGCRVRGSDINEPNRVKLNRNIYIEQTKALLVERCWKRE